MKKTVYRILIHSHRNVFDWPMAGMGEIVLCKGVFHRFFPSAKMPCWLVVTDQPTRSPNALAVRFEDEDLIARYPEMGSESVLEYINSTLAQDNVIRRHQGPDGWAYVWVEVES